MRVEYKMAAFGPALNSLKLDALIIGSKMREWSITLSADERIFLTEQLGSIVVSAGIDNGFAVIQNLLDFGAGGLVQFAEVLSSRPALFHYFGNIRA
jgi:hypothetical protein